MVEGEEKNSIIIPTASPELGMGKFDRRETQPRGSDWLHNAQRIEKFKKNKKNIRKNFSRRTREFSCKSARKF